LEYLLALPLSIISFGLQVWPRLSNRYFGIDIWRHLTVAGHYREQRRGQAKPFNRYLIDLPSDYPPGLRVLLSFIPTSFLHRIQWLVAPIIDSVHNILLFVLAVAITGNIGAGLVAQAAYMLAPLVVMENSSLSTRPLASLLFTATMAANLAFHSSNVWAWIILSIPAAALLFLTHRMALQALFVTSIALSIILFNPYYVLVFVGGWTLALLVSRGAYWHVFRGHMAMLWWWRANIHNRYAHQIRGVPKASEQSGDAVFKIYQIVRRLPLLAVLAANPFISFAIVVTCSLAFNMGLIKTVIFETELNFLLIWALSLFVVGIAIRQLHAIEWLGEGERYGEYGAFPTAIITGVLITETTDELKWVGLGVFFVVALGAGLIPSVALQRRVIVGDSSRSLTPDLQTIMDALNNRQTEARLMTIPLSLADFALYFSSAKVLSTDSSFGHLQHYSDFFPVLRVPINVIFRRFDINLLLINESYVSLDELGLGSAPIEKRSGPFCLVNVDQQQVKN